VGKFSDWVSAARKSRAGAAVALRHQASNTARTAAQRRGLRTPPERVAIVIRPSCANAVAAAPMPDRYSKAFSAKSPARTWSRAQDCGSTADGSGHASLPFDELQP